MSTPFSCNQLVHLRKGKVKGKFNWKTYSANRLAQLLRLDNHAFTVRNLPKRARENACIKYLQALTHTKVLDPLSEEELVTEERFYDRRDACSQAGARSASSTMMRRSIHLSKQPVVWRGLDLMDFRRQRHFRASGIDFLIETLGPAFAQNASDVGLEDGLNDSLCQSGRVIHDNRAKPNVDEFLAVGTGLSDEISEFFRRSVGRALIQKPVSCYANPVRKIKRFYNHRGAEIVEEGNFVRLKFVQTGGLNAKALLPPAVDLSCCSSPEDRVEEDIGEGVVVATQLLVWDCKGMRI